MAEFQEVMRQWRRMCKICTCSSKWELIDSHECPIISEHCSYPCDEYPQDWTEETIEQFEKIVMAWAAERPEPVYPTWCDWFYEGFLKWCQTKHPGRAKDEKAWYDYLYETRIPADIAQKLGIEPKEV